MTTDRPIKQTPYRIPFSLQTEADTQITELLQHGIIRGSKSPWTASCVLVKKNPLPRIEEIFDKLSNEQYFTILDLAKGYYRIEINEPDKEKIRILNRGGTTRVQ